MPRAKPQIDVTFDIDANGILNVMAEEKVRCPLLIRQSPQQCARRPALKKCRATAPRKFAPAPPSAGDVGQTLFTGN